MEKVNLNEKAYQEMKQFVSNLPKAGSIDFQDIEEKQTVILNTKRLSGEYELEWGYYTCDDSPALFIMRDNIIQATASVNVGGISCSLKDNLILLKGWGENEGLPEALEDAGVVRLTGNKVKTGFCYALEAEII